MHFQALEAGRGQHDGVVLTFVELAQPRVQVAAQGLNAQVRPQGLEQHQPAQARSADHRALRQGRQAGVGVGDKRVTRVFALHHAGQRKAGRQIHGHVFERMHGDVGTAVGQRGFEFFDKQTLAANLAQRAVQNLVALRGHAQQLDLPAQAVLQQGLHMFGLPHGQSAFAGGDDDFETRFFACWCICGHA